MRETYSTQRRITVAETEDKAEVKAVLKEFAYVVDGVYRLYRHVWRDPQAPNTALEIETTNAAGSWQHRWECFHDAELNTRVVRKVR